MGTSSRHGHSEERASEWLAKRDSGDWSNSDQLQLTQWLSASTANRVAYLRLEAAWQETRRLKALGAGGRPGEVPPAGQWNLSPFLEKPSAAATPAVGSDRPDREVIPDDVAHSVRPSKRFRLYALAASMLLAVAAGGTWLLRPAGQPYSTPVGGLASLPMGDGSKITLNTNSEIRVAVTETERRVELHRGEAFFEVSKDPSRPFIVKAGNEQVVAVGTQFSVRCDGDDVRVIVTEGKVKLERAPSEAAADSAGPVTLLSAGSVARTGESGVIVQEKPLSEVDEYLSWRTGYLVFRQTALVDAVAEFNRYNQRQIVVADRSVADLRISGTFRATNAEAFVRLLQDLPIRAEHDDDKIILKQN